MAYNLIVEYLNRKFMDANRVVEYAPIVICVLAFLYQQRLVVTPEQLEKKHREIMEDCESKFATIQDNLHVKETVGDIKDKVDAIYNKLIGDNL